MGFLRCAQAQRIIKMVTFGHTTVGGPFGSVDGQEWPSEWRCWEIEGERGEYKQNVVKSHNPLRPDAIWMQLEGYHFVECECIRGEPGKEPEKCKWSTCNPWDVGGAQCPPTTLTSETDSDGKERYYFERILKCTPKETCGPESTQQYPGSSDQPCEDYARCCFKGEIRVDQDTLSSPEYCVNPGEGRSLGIFTSITRSGWCGDYVGSWLAGNPVNPRCDMNVNCLWGGAQPNENENVRCDFNFFEGHPND